MSSFWRPTPLPSLDVFNEKLKVEHSHRVTQQSAYKFCLELEKSTVAKTVMHARVLGYLILHAPNHAAEAEIAKSIVSCAGNIEKLDELGESFVKWFINVCKHDTYTICLPTPWPIVRKSKGRAPIPSYHPSRPSFDREREVMSAQLEAAPKEHEDAKAQVQRPFLRKEPNSASALQALIRDGYRCLITGVYDLLAESQLGISPEQVDAVGEVNTQCAHIVPASTHFNVGVDEQGEPTDKVYFILYPSAVTKSLFVRTSLQHRCCPS